MKVDKDDQILNFSDSDANIETNQSTLCEDHLDENMKNQQLSAALILSQNNQHERMLKKQSENSYLINNRTFQEQRQFILRTLCLIQFHLLGPLILCVFCMFKTFIVELLYDKEEQKFSFLFYISVALEIFILFSVTLSRKNARKTPYAQSAYVFFGIFLSFILAGLYSSTYYSENQNVGFIILAIINIFQGSNAGALFYFATLKQKKSTLYSLPFICIFPLLLSLIYMFFMQNEILKIACWMIAIISIVLAILSVNALYQIIDGAFKLEKEQHCIATIFIYIKMIVFCKEF
ncbi:unnamed protein product [Paramecium pentaurelia]|uniref:Transmembrane protein n=1 Tax=Paramecium pentaurelia TaxID=43138 RepID=A0A8S1UPE1_9CILI|nr:unnamed protein product [Paramecium pentaurelia]